MKAPWTLRLARWRGWWRYVWRDWLHPCPDCRRWFGRHDGRVEHAGGLTWE